MSRYLINPQIDIDSENILNIMSQILLNISNSIQSINNIVINENYILMINKINQILNNYLKIYNFFNYGITTIGIQIYNQNVEIVSFIIIQLNINRYINIFSNWDDFIVGNYNQQNKIIYNLLTQQQKNDLNYSIVSGDLYFLNDINENNISGMLLKPKNNNCKCINQSNNIYNTKNKSNYVYISTIYWNFQ